MKKNIIDLLKLIGYNSEESSIEKSQNATTIKKIRENQRLQKKTTKDNIK